MKPRVELPGLPGVEFDCELTNDDRVRVHARLVAHGMAFVEGAAVAHLTEGQTLDLMAEAGRGAARALVEHLTEWLEKAKAAL